MEIKNQAHDFFLSLSSSPGLYFYLISILSCYLSMLLQSVYWLYILSLLICLKIYLFYHYSRNTFLLILLAFYFCFKKHQNQLEEEIIFLPYRNLEAGIQAENKENNASWLAPHAQPAFSYSRTTFSGVAPSALGWNIPHQSLFKKMPPESCLQVNIMEA